MNTVQFPFYQVPREDILQRREENYPGVATAEGRQPPFQLGNSKTSGYRGGGSHVTGIYFANLKGMQIESFIFCLFFFIFFLHSKQKKKNLKWPQK